MIDTLQFAEALAARLAEVLKGVPAETRPRVDAIGLTVRFAESDPRYQVIEVNARMRAVDSTWRPSTFSRSVAGTIGDPVTDPALADVWREHERDMGLGWDEVVAPTTSVGASQGRSPVEQKRLAFLGTLPTTVKYLRRRLNRQVGWSRALTFVVVTDRIGDQMVLVTEQANDTALPADAYRYLRDVEVGRLSV